MKPAQKVQPALPASTWATARTYLLDAAYILGILTTLIGALLSGFLFPASPRLRLGLAAAFLLLAGTLL